MRKQRKAPNFHGPSEGALHVAYDVYADVVTVSVGPRRAAYHVSLDNGISLRFDEQTHRCIGFVMVTGMAYEAPVVLPLWAVLTLLEDAHANDRPGI